MAKINLELTVVDGTVDELQADLVRIIKDYTGSISDVKLETSLNTRDFRQTIHTWDVTIPGADKHIEKLIQQAHDNIK